MYQSYVISRPYDYAARDVWVAFVRAAEKRYGPKALGTLPGHEWKFWKRRPLHMVSVKTGLTEQTMGIYGDVYIKEIPATFHIEDSMVSVLDISEDRKDEAIAFFDAIQEVLDKESIYRGKAFETSGEFLDLSAINRDDMVYNEKTLRDLSAHVWTMIERPDLCVRAHIGQTRKILFSGPFGSGKTTAALLTAKTAVTHGHSFIYVRPTAKDGIGIIRSSIALARRYQPSVLFIEDYDREQREGNSWEHGAIMAEIDGVKSKGSKIIILLTTNHEGNIGKGMFRPGRIDKIVNFGTFTSADMERLLRKIIPPEWLDPHLNWTEVTGHCARFTAAFIEEVAKAAMLFAISEDAETPRITAPMLIEAAKDLSVQHERSNAKIGF